MTIERLDTDNLLITLKKDDLTIFEITADSFTTVNDKTTILLKQIISLSLVKAGVTAIHKRITVNTIPYNSGCFVLVTLRDRFSHKKYRTMGTYVLRLFYINRADSLLTVIKYLHDNDIKCKSTLYSCKPYGYYLLLKINQHYDSDIKRYLSEYGKRVPCDNLTISKLDETCQILCNENAVSYIGKLL